MVIKKSKKTDRLKNNISSYEQRELERDRKYKEELRLKKQKELEEKLAKEHMHKVVKEYLDKLQSSLKEKGLGHYYLDFDTETYTKIKKDDFSKISKNIKKDFNSLPKKEAIEKYKSTKAIQIKFLFHHNDKDDSLMKSSDIWLRVGISRLTIDDKGDFETDCRKFWDANCVMVWEPKDFAITKPTFKFINAVTHILKSHAFGCGAGFVGVPLPQVIRNINKKLGLDIKINDYLTPLAGI